MCYAQLYTVVVFLLQSSKGSDNIENKFIPTFIVKNIFRADNRLEGFTENHLLLLVHLQEYTSIRDKIYFTFNFMFERLGITYYELKKELYQCLVDLDDWSLIDIISDIENINQNTMIIINKVQYDRDFTILIADEVDKILYCDEDIRVKKTLLYIYTIIVSWIGINGRQYCFPTRDQFKDDLQIKSNQRITSAVYKLKELGLIDFDNVGVVRNDSKIYQSNNIYVLTSTDNYKEVLTQALEESKYYYETMK